MAFIPAIVFQYNNIKIFPFSNIKFYHLQFLIKIFNIKLYQCNDGLIFWEKKRTQCLSLTLKKKKLMRFKKDVVAVY